MSGLNDLRPAFSAQEQAKGGFLATQSDFHKEVKRRKNRALRSESDWSLCAVIKSSHRVKNSLIAPNRFPRTNTGLKNEVKVRQRFCGMWIKARHADLACR